MFGKKMGFVKFGARLYAVGFEYETISHAHGVCEMCGLMQLALFKNKLVRILQIEEIYLGVTVRAVDLKGIEAKGAQKEMQKRDFFKITYCVVCDPLF